MSLPIHIEPREGFGLRITLDNGAIFDFDVRAALERIPCYKALYDTAFFKTVKF